MSIEDKRGRIGTGVQLSHAEQVELAKMLKDKGYANVSIARIMRFDETVVRVVLEDAA